MHGENKEHDSIVQQVHCISIYGPGNFIWMVNFRIKKIKVATSLQKNSRNGWHLKFFPWYPDVFSRQFGI